ncbi:MAG: response regulator [Pedobacter sp.]|nr:MAG: response regulator [Pedobacter sp.]
MKPKIFILEDDESIRDLYPYILGEENYDMSTFSCAKDFKKKIREIPQMYILDVMLPDGNGLDIYKELQENPATANVPVLIMSAHEDPVYVRKQFPGVSFLAKPFDIVNLIDSVAKNIRLAGA